MREKTTRTLFIGHEQCIFWKGWFLPKRQVTLLCVLTIMVGFLTHITMSLASSLDMSLTISSAFLFTYFLLGCSWKKVLSLSLRLRLLTLSFSEQKILPKSISFGVASSSLSLQNFYAIFNNYQGLEYYEHSSTSMLQLRMKTQESHILYKLQKQS